MSLLLFDPSFFINVMFSKLHLFKQDNDACFQRNMGPSLSQYSEDIAEPWVMVEKPAGRTKKAVRPAESEESVDEVPPPPPPPRAKATVDCASSDSVSPTRRPRGRESQQEERLRGRKDVPGLDEALPDSHPSGKGGKGAGRNGRDRCEFCWKPVSHFKSSQEQHRWFNVRCLRWQRYLRGDCTWTHAGHYAEAVLAARHDEADLDPSLFNAQGKDTLPDDLEALDSRVRKQMKKKRRAPPLIRSPDSPKRESRRRSPPSSDHEYGRNCKARQLGPGAWLITMSH